MNKINQLIILLLVIISTFLFCNYGYVMHHEKTHEEIYKIHGCEEIEISYNAFKGETVCLKHAEVIDEMYLQEQELHAINEIVSYNLRAFAAIILLLFTIFMVYDVLKQKP